MRVDCTSALLIRNMSTRHWGRGRGRGERFHRGESHLADFDDFLQGDFFDLKIPLLGRENSEVKQLEDMARAISRLQPVKIDRNGQHPA